MVPNHSHGTNHPSPPHPSPQTKLPGRGKRTKHEPRMLQPEWERETVRDSCKGQTTFVVDAYICHRPFQLKDATLTARPPPSCTSLDGPVTPSETRGLCDSTPPTSPPRNHYRSSTPGSLDSLPSRKVHPCRTHVSTVPSWRTDPWFLLHREIYRLEVSRLERTRRRDTGREMVRDPCIYGSWVGPGTP